MSSFAERYIDVTIELLRKVKDEELPAIEAAAADIAAAITSGARVFAFGCSHSSLAVQDLVYRAGGLMLVNPLFAPGLASVDIRPVTLGSALEKLPGLAGTVLEHSPARRGDVLIIVSVSGRNAVPIEMAQLAREKGMLVVGVTSRPCTEAVESRHASGHKLKDVCDHVLDSKVSPGDAELDAPGLPQRFGPASNVVNVAILHSLVAAVVERLSAREATPPVFMSANADGGHEWNDKLLAEHADRIFYL